MMNDVPNGIYWIAQVFYLPFHGLSNKSLYWFHLKVTLTILDINRDKLLACTEDGQAMQILSQYLEGIYNDEAVALSTEPRSAPKVSRMDNRFACEKVS